MVSGASGLNRFGFTSVFYLGELLGLACIFTGFLVSQEVFAHRERSVTRTTPGSKRNCRSISVFNSFRRCALCADSEGKKPFSS